MSVATFRGADSPVNHCMWAFAEYAARVRPQVAVFESVPSARTRPDGHELMRKLHARVESLTGLQWTLYHVRHNAYSLGGAAIRPRYFWVIARIPFGIESPSARALPVLRDVIGDLAHLETTWEEQPYRSPTSRWASTRRSQSGATDSHVGISTPLTRRIVDLLEAATWYPGEALSAVAERCWQETGKLPPSWNVQRVVHEKKFQLGYTLPIRWNGERPARVIDGSALQRTVHPWLNRCLTHREAARIMGFPDDWHGARALGNALQFTWGKGITVDCGRWIGMWIRHALDGEPGSHVGERIGEREYDINVSNAYKKFLVQSTPQAIPRTREAVA
jgi:site-specific DNA-cytosine methylase